MSGDPIIGAVYQDKADRRYKIRVLATLPEFGDEDPWLKFRSLDSGHIHYERAAYITENYELEQA